MLPEKGQFEAEGRVTIVASASQHRKAGKKCQAESKQMSRVQGKSRSGQRGQEHACRGNKTLQRAKSRAAQGGCICMYYNWKYSSILACTAHTWSQSVAIKKQSVVFATQAACNQAHIVTSCGSALGLVRAAPRARRGAGGSRVASRRRGGAACGCG